MGIEPQFKSKSQSNAAANPWLEWVRDSTGTEGSDSLFSLGQTPRSSRDSHRNFRRSQTEAQPARTWRRVWRCLNPQYLAQTLFLIGLTLAVVISLITGRWTQWIHPRYLTFLGLAVPILLAMAYAVATRSFEGLGRLRKSALVTLALPVLALYFLWRPVYSETIRLEPYEEVGLGRAQDFQSFGGLTVGGAAGADLLGDPAEKIPNVAGSIAIDGAHYAAWLAEVIARPQAYEGKTYTFLSRLDPSPFDPEGSDFLAGRPVMMCCAADAQALGLYAQKTEAVSGHIGQWAYVTATVKQGPGGHPAFPAEQGARLEIQSVTPAPTPKSIFAYYYGSLKIPTDVMKAED